MYNHAPIYIWLLVLSFLIIGLTFWVLTFCTPDKPKSRLPKGFKPNPGHIPVQEGTPVDVVYNSGEIKHNLATIKVLDKHSE